MDPVGFFQRRALNDGRLSVSRCLLYRNWTNMWNRGPFVGALGYAVFMRVRSDMVERAEEQALLG
jgi:hypothetical protein